jgi:hypothetical protein
MYKINKKKNNIIKLEERLFSDLKIRERQHLQEWICKNPEILSDKILIIQKEFDGFEGTRERLDLLALDEEGNLIIIENKLDDSGKDVVWQALKYTSYCSTFTTEEITTHYQDYLDKYENGSNAIDNLEEFLGASINDIVLNSGEQSIFFVANNFSKEVTSTVLWLLDHDVQIKCIKATPYSMNEDLFLQVEQIIPLPETQGYIIKSKKKEKEISIKKKEGNKILINFWSKLLVKVESLNYPYLKGRSANSYHDFGFWKSNGYFAYCLGRDTIRVELYLGADQDRAKLNGLLEFKKEIESAFGNSIIFENKPTKKTTKLKFEIDDALIKVSEDDFNDGGNWEAYINWFVPTMDKFFNAVYPHWQKVHNNLK